MESLYLNLKEKKLVINGKEIPLKGITDFTLTTQGTGWYISGKRDIMAEICEEHDCQERANPAAEHINKKEARGMLRKIHQELAAIRKELQAIHKALEPDNKILMVREPYSSRYKLVEVKTDSGEPTVEERPMEWRRFELTTESEAETERLERLLDEHKLSRRDLAIILFGLRVRPEFDKEHFGI